MQVRKHILSFLIVVFVLFSLAPTLYELSRMGDLQPNRSFELVHNFPTDYNFYLSRIRQGLEGRLTVVETYTSEPHEGSFIHEMYLLMGQMGRIARVPTSRVGDIYHIARIVFAFVLLSSIAEFCIKSFPMGKSNVVDRISEKQGNIPYTITHIRLIAFLLAVTASSWPKLVAVVNNAVVPATLSNSVDWRFGGFMAWWSVMDSLQRITFIPHLLAGQALIVVLVMLLTSKALSRGINVVFVGLLAFVLGMLFPPGLVFIYAVMGIYVLMSGRKWKTLAAPFGAVFFISSASLLYLGLMTGMYPWKRLIEVDVIRPLPFDYLEYVRALGPILPSGLIGLFMALLAKERVLFPAVVWVLAWAALLGIFAFVPQQSPLRFSEMIPHVPLGILTAYVLSRLRYVGRWLAILLVAIGIFHMYSSYLWQRDFVDHKIRATTPLVPTGSYVMYPLKDFISAMRYIQEQSKGRGTVLAETTAGNYIPVVSGNSVYAGHDNTVAFETKKETVRQFFSGRMNAAMAKKWVHEIGAAYVFFGPQEKEDGGIQDLTDVYPFLSEVYTNTFVTVYRVTPL